MAFSNACRPRTAAAFSRRAARKAVTASACDLRQYDALRRRADFARVTRRGRRSATPHLTCFVADGRIRTRVGITVGGSVGNAVIRNRLRRRIKAILDGYALGSPPWRDVVFIARPGAGELSFAALGAEVARALPR